MLHKTLGTIRNQEKHYLQLYWEILIHSTPTTPIYAFLKVRTFINMFLKQPQIMEFSLTVLYINSTLYPIDIPIDGLLLFRPQLDHITTSKNDYSVIIFCIIYSLIAF